MTNFWSSKTARILTVVLLAQAGVFYGFSRQENVPLHRVLSGFTLGSGGPWISVQDQQLDQDTLDVLKADDSTLR